MLFCSHEHIFLIQLLLDRDPVEAKADRLVKNNPNKKQIYLFRWNIFIFIKSIWWNTNIILTFSTFIKLEKRRYEAKCLGEFRTLFCALRNLTSYLSVFRFSSLICSSISRSEF
jgi:hypothetical protein